MKNINKFENFKSNDIPNEDGYYWALVEPDAPSWEPVSVFFNSDEINVILIGNENIYSGSEIEDIIIRFGPKLTEPE